MKKTSANRLLKYGITSGVCLLLAAVYFFSNIPFSEIGKVSTVDLMLILCDAFFLPGTFALMLGLLMWVASEGALDGVGYLGSCLVKTLIPGKHGEFERYGEYVERKRGSRKKGYGFLCIVGLNFLLIACAFWAAFYLLY